MKNRKWKSETRVMYEIFKTIQKQVGMFYVKVTKSFIIFPTGHYKIERCTMSIHFLCYLVSQAFFLWSLLIETIRNTITQRLQALIKYSMHLKELVSTPKFFNKEKRTFKAKPMLAWRRILIGLRKIWNDLKSYSLS